MTKSIGNFEKRLPVVRIVIGGWHELAYMVTPHFECVFQIISTPNDRPKNLFFTKSQMHEFKGFFKTWKNRAKIIIKLTRFF